TSRHSIDGSAGCLRGSIRNQRIGCEALSVLRLRGTSVPRGLVGGVAGVFAGLFAGDAPCDLDAGDERLLLRSFTVCWSALLALLLLEVLRPSFDMRPGSDPGREIGKPPISRSSCSRILRIISSGSMPGAIGKRPDRKSTRLNSTHVKNSDAVFCVQKRKSPTAAFTAL